MLDKKKYPKLYKETQQVINKRREWLAQAIKAQSLCDLLPEEIKKLDITDADYGYPDTLSLTIKNTNGTVPTLKRLGIQGLKPQVSSFSKEDFHTRGEGKLPNGTKLAIWVSNIAKPEGCAVITKRSTKTEYVLVCEGTGKEVK